MKKIFNISLYIIIFLLVASINVMSIKKYFDIKKCIKLDNIVAVNNISSFISFNKLEANEYLIDSIKEQDVEIIDDESLNAENIEKEIIEDLEFQDSVIQEKEESTIIENNDITSNNSTSNINDILFDGLTEIELINKLEKSLKNELSGTGINFVEYYKSAGLDPYLSVAIVLHETGCTWTCSNLVKQCYNYGGMKGGANKYKDTKYTCYASKEEGINAYLDMLYNNYYSKGLTTAELINPKYATSLEWAVKINNYIEKIKSK